MSIDRESPHGSPDVGQSSSGERVGSAGKTTRSSRLGPSGEAVAPNGMAATPGYSFYPPFEASSGAAPPSDGRDDPFGLHLGASARPSHASTDGEHLPVQMRSSLESAAGGALDDVRVHHGPAATAAASAEGAHAFTYGNNIVLGDGLNLGSPDVGPLLAHEAAHVVQQRGASPTLQRKRRGGNDAGAAEDAADRSADRYRDQAERSGQNVDARNYFRAYLATHIAPAISEAWRSRRFSLKHPRLHWTEHGREVFAYEVAAMIEEIFGDKADRGLEQLLSPTNLWKLVDKNRLITEQGDNKFASFFMGDKPVPSALQGDALGPMRWVPDVAVAIRSRLEERVIAALPKVAARYVALHDQKQAIARATKRKVVAPTAAEIIPGHAIDRPIIRALCMEDMVRVEEEREKDSSTQDDKASEDVAAPRKPRALESLHWVTEKGMWNWVKVEPADATPEEVAYYLWKDHSAAERLTASPPFFAIRVEEAAKFREARFNRGRGDGGNIFDRMEAANEAANVTVARAEVDRDPAFDPNAQLAKSKIATEAAIAQAARVESPTRSEREGNKELPQTAQPAVADGQHAYAPVLTQLQALSRLVAPMGLAGELVDVTQRTEVRSAQLEQAPPETAGQLAKLARLQHAVLLQIGGRLAAVMAGSSRRDADAKKAGPASVNAAAGLVRAAAHSDLPETAQAELARALEQQRTVAADVMEALLADALGRVEALTMNRGLVRAEMRGSEELLGSLYARQRDLRERVAVLRSRMLEGVTVAEAEIKDVLVQIDSLHFEAEMLTNLNAMRGVFESIDGMLKSDWVLLAGQGMDLANVKEGGKKLRDELRIAHQAWIQAITEARELSSRPGAGRPDEAAAFVASRLDGAKARLHRLAGEADVRAYLQKAYEEIDDASTRAMVVQVAIYIGVSLVAAEVGGAVAIAANTARGAEATALGGQIVGALTQSTIIAGFSAAASDQPGDSFGTLFVSDLLATMATLGALGALEEGMKGTRMARVIEGAEDASSHARIAYRSLHMTLRTLTVGATQVGAMQMDSVLRTGRSMTGQEMLANGEMGIAMMITHGVINRLRARRLDHVDRLGPEAKKLLERRATLEKAATSAEDSPTPEIARKLLAEERAIYELEVFELRRRIDEIGPGDKKLEAQAAGAAASRDTVVATQGAEIIASMGLDPVVPGRSYAGTTAEIDSAITQLRSLGFATTDVRQGGQRHVEAMSPDGRAVLELVERRERVAAGDTAPIDASVPAYARTTAKMAAVSDPDAVISSDAQTVLRGPPPLPEVEAPRTVEPGPAYEQARATVRTAYVRVGDDVRQVREIRGHQVEGSYKWIYGHDSYVADGTAHVVFRIFLSPGSPSVTAADLAKVRAQARVGVERYYNKPVHEVTGSGAGKHRLKLDVEFVDDRAAAHLVVTVHEGNGIARVGDWFVDGDPTSHTHEITHGAFGIHDEYRDPRGLAPDRATPASRGVHHDDSLMGNFWKGKDELVDPRTRLHQRHLDEIERQVFGDATPPLNAERGYQGTEKQAMYEYFPAAPHARSSAGVAHAPGRRGLGGFVDSAMRTKAALELSHLEVRTYRSPEDPRPLYAVSNEDFERLTTMLQALGPSVRFRVYGRGLTMHIDGEDWVIRRVEDIERRGDVSREEAGDRELGRAVSNASVIELHGFRRVRHVNNIKIEDLPADQKQTVDDVIDLDPLLGAGHVGMSFDGGESIFGLRPQTKGDGLTQAEFDQVVERVTRNKDVPGIIGDDTRTFRLAEKLAREQGWDTEITVAAQLVSAEKRAEVMAQIGEWSRSNGTHGKKYTWPFREPDEQGRRFPDENTANCALFPKMLGLCVPEESGELRKYIPALKRWAEEGPVDGTKGSR